jgi:PAS domain S-box-containing protein
MSLLNSIQYLWPRKLSKKLALTNILILCTAILGFAWYSASLQVNQRFQADRAQLRIFTKNIAALAAKYLQSKEYDQLETKVSQLIHYPGVTNILIINNETRYILSVKIKPDQTVYTETSPEFPLLPSKDQLTQVEKGFADFWQLIHIDKNKATTGWVRVEYDTRHFNQISMQIFKNSLSIALIAILLSLLTLKKLLLKPSRDLRRAAEFAEFLDISQGNSIEVTRSSQEIEQLLRALNRASKKLHLHEESQRSNALLLDTIREIQSQFISEMNIHVVFETFVSKIVQLTKSEYGFFGEVLLTEKDKPCLKMCALSHLSFNKRTQEFYDKYDFKNLQFTNMNNLIGASIQAKKPVIANDAATDPRRGGLPEGHPNVSAFLGLPVFSRGRVVGVVGLANRTGGYDQGVVAYLQPLLTTCSDMIEAHRNELNRKQIQDELKRNNDKLHTVLNSVSDGIITISQQGKISSVNATAASMFTYNTASMLGDNIVNYISGLQNRSGKLFVNGEQIHVHGCNEKIKWRMEGRHKGGQAFPVEIGVSEFMQGQESSYTITVRSLENDVGIYEIKEDLIYTFDKEVKETLGSIRGSLVLLK